MGKSISAVTRFVLIAGLAGCAAAGEKATGQPDETVGWKLACQAYTFGRNGVSAFETIDILHSIEVRYIEFYPGQKFSNEKPDARVDHAMSDELMAALQAKLKAAGVQPVAYGVVGLSRNEAESRKVFEWCRKMGIRTICSEPAPDAFDTIEKLCKEYGIAVALHNHPKDSPYWNPDTVLQRSQGRSRLIGACADTGHWARSGLVPVECLRKLEGRIVELHFKDLNKMGADAHDVVWGNGVCDFRGMLKELKRQGFRGVFSIEYEIGSGQELKDNVAKCASAFRAAVQELAGG